MMSRSEKQKQKQKQKKRKQKQQRKVTHEWLSATCTYESRKLQHVVLFSRHYLTNPSATTVRFKPFKQRLCVSAVSSLKPKRVQVLTQHSVKFARLDRIRDEIAELGDVAVSMETDVVNRQQVKSN